MLAEVNSEQSDFSNQLQREYQKLLEAHPLSKVRAKAWDHFLELGLPTRHSEVFRYIRLPDLYSRSYELADEVDVPVEDVQRHIYPECQGSVLVLVNGAYCPRYSKVAGVMVSSLGDAMGTYGAFLNNRWARALKEETDPFAALNIALHRQGVFVYVPPKVVLDAPLQILNIIVTDGGYQMLAPRVQFFVGAHAQVSVVMTAAALRGQDYWCNQVVDCTIEEGAQVKMSQVSLKQSAATWHLSAVRAQLKKHATFTSVSVTDGAGSVREDYRATLSGEGATASLSGAALLHGKREAHVCVHMEHKAPYCQSNQLFKNVLDDLSRSSFEGKIVVTQAAQKTNAFQRNNNLLLSDRAQANSKPNLEIFADDVKASHGATVGQLSVEELFYLKSRGFSSNQAKALLVYGFCQDIYDALVAPSARREVQAYAKNYLVNGK